MTTTTLCIKAATAQEVIQAERTDDVRADASLCKQRCDLQLIDVFGLPLPSVGVDVDQQVFGSAG